MTDETRSRRITRRVAIVIVATLAALGGTGIHLWQRAATEAEAVTLLESRGWFVSSRGPSWLPDYLRDSMAVTAIGINGETATDEMLGDAELEAVSLLRHLRSIHIFGGVSKFERFELQRQVKLPFEEMDPKIQSSFVGKVRRRKPEVEIEIHPGVPAESLPRPSHGTP